MSARTAWTMRAGWRRRGVQASRAFPLPGWRLLPEAEVKLDALLGCGEVWRKLQRQPRMAGQPFAFRPHRERLLLHRRKDGGDLPHVEIGRDPRITGPRDHRRQLAALELLQGPCERVFDQCPVPIDAVVLVARAIVVMRAVPEVIKGQE